MAVYYRVNLNNKQGEIIYPTIDNEIDITQNSFHSMKNIILGDASDNKMVELVLRRYSNTFEQGEGFEVYLGNDASVYFKKYLHGTNDSLVWFNYYGIYFRIASAAGEEIGTTNYLVSATNRNEQLTGQKTFTKSIRCNFTTSTWKNTYNGENVAINMLGAAGHNVLAVANSTNGKFSVESNATNFRVSYFTQESVAENHSVHTAILLNESGNTSLPGNLQLIRATSGNWIIGKTLSNCLVSFTGSVTESAYHPLIGIKTYGGHTVNIGALGNYFGIYAFLKNRTANGVDYYLQLNTGSGLWQSNINISAPLFSGPVGTDTITMYLHNNNQIDFGGTGTATTIHFGYSTLNSRPYPAAYYFDSGPDSRADVYCKNLYGTATDSTRVVNTTVAGSTNFNDFTPPSGYLKIYRCASNATVATISNRPSGNAFVCYSSSHAGCNQLSIEYLASGFQIFTRNYYNGTWGSWYKIAHSGCGDFGFSGLIKSTKNSNTVTIGSQNASYCHIYNSADIPFYFNKPVYVNNGYYVVGSGNASVKNLYALALSTWNSNYSSYVNGTVGFCY